MRAGADGKARVWDAWFGRELTAFDCQRGALTAAMFSRDGKRLVTAGTDTTALIWNAEPLRERLPDLAATVPPDPFDELWSQLGDSDSRKARAAIRALAGHPDKAVPLLRRNVRAVAAPDPEVIEQLVAGLDDAKFAVRDKSRRELQRLGRLAAPALRDAVHEQGSAEVRRQAERLLEAIAAEVPTREQVRTSRALEVLELAGTQDAVSLLKALAAGAPEVIPTPQAQAALERLAHRR